MPNRWFDLGDWTVMAITGPQATPFLQGQVTTDVRDLAGGESRLGAHCTPKGRMQFSFRAIALTEEHLLLRVHHSMVDAVKASLGKYIVFSKAELTDESEHFTRRGLMGKEAASALVEQGLLKAPLTTPGQWLASDDGSIILALSDDRYECWLTPDTAKRLDQAFGSPEPGAELWRLADIRAGIGEVMPGTREQFTPQALNFPQVGAVSFRKGCYTGQEIVARLHYKGKLKNHMRRLIALDEGGEGRPGMNVHREDGKKVGDLILAAPNEKGILECLAVLDDGSLEETLTIGDASGEAVFSARAASLPYTVE